jgi:ribonuclease BN (tRNA processing enzyme)
MIVYVTDSGYLENINLPSGVDAFIIEANHDEEVLRELIELNDENKIRYERVISRLGHLSVQKTETFLERTSDINTKKIVLCHLSRSNYEPNKFRNIIAAKFPNVEVYELDPTEVSNVQEVVLRKKKINFSEL